MKDLIRTKWAAVGAAVAVTLGAGGVSLTQAAISSGEKPVYVALVEPCRLVDTRPASNIGPKNTPIAAGEASAYEIQVTGANGNCTGALAIPAEAVAVAANVTAIAPVAPTTGRSFFTVYPGDAALPTTSNLNFLNGAPPAPNKVDVGLSATGTIRIFNNEGTAHAAVDVFGYYIDHNHDDRYYTETEVDTAIASATDAVPRPVAYGYVDAAGVLQGGIGIVSASWDGTRYVIDLDESYFYADFATTVTTICSAHVARTGSVSGNLLVYITDGANAAAQCGFSFTVFKNP